MKKILQKIKSFFKSKNHPNSEYEMDIRFSISIGEICQSCEKELEINNGGYTGKPQMCKECTRHKKLKELGI